MARRTSSSMAGQMCAVLLTGVLASLQPAAAWWDEGHMLVATIASQYLAKTNDLFPLLQVLGASADGLSDLPAGTFADLASGAIWMDEIKCSSSAPYCPISTLPSISVFGNWHYTSRCLPINYYSDSANPCPQQDRLDKGILDYVLPQALQSLNSAKSVGTASFVLKVLLHLVGDMHQPAHAVDGVDVNQPGGDAGGNARRFNASCQSSNLHALWDSAGGKYTTNWSPNATVYAQVRAQLQAEADMLISQKVGLPDKLHSEDLDNITSWADAYAFIADGDNSLINRILADTAQVAKTYVYPRSLNLNVVPGGTSACPSADYFAKAQNASTAQIAVAGFRASKILRAVSKQLVASGLAPTARRVNRKL